MRHAKRILVFRLVTLSILGIGFSEPIFADSKENSGGTAVGAAPADNSVKKLFSGLIAPAMNGAAASPEKPEAKASPAEPIASEKKTPLSPKEATKTIAPIVESFDHSSGLLNSDAADSILEKVRKRRLSGLGSSGTSGSILERVRKKRPSGLLNSRAARSILDKVEDGMAEELPSILGSRDSAGK